MNRVAQIRVAKGSRVALLLPPLRKQGRVGRAGLVWVGLVPLRRYESASLAKPRRLFLRHSASLGKSRRLSCQGAPGKRRNASPETASLFGCVACVAGKQKVRVANEVASPAQTFASLLWFASLNEAKGVAKRCRTSRSSRRLRFPQPSAVSEDGNDAQGPCFNGMASP